MHVMHLVRIVYAYTVQAIHERHVMNVNVLLHTESAAPIIWLFEGNCLSPLGVIDVASAQQLYFLRGRSIHLLSLRDGITKAHLIASIFRKQVDYGGVIKVLSNSLELGRKHRAKFYNTGLYLLIQRVMELHRMSVHKSNKQ